MRPHGRAEDLERRRHEAIRLVTRDGLTQTEAARRVGVNARSVRLWMQRHRKQGVAGLKSRPTPGRPPKLTASQRQQLQRILLAGAVKAGFPTELWTLPRVAEITQRRFSIRYHVDHLGRLLRSLGFTPQKPARRAAERDDAAIQGWVQRAWPRLKKTLPAAGKRSSLSTNRDS